jgi:hypothetical protein
MLPLNIDIKSTVNDTFGNIMLPLNIDSMEDIGVNKRQSSQSRLIAKEPDAT